MKHLSRKSSENLEKKIDIGLILSNITPNQDLSPREFEILNELIKGESNEKIAYRLFISKDALRTHIKNINKKWCIKGLYGGRNSKAILAARQQIYVNALEMYFNQSVTSHKR